MISSVAATGDVSDINCWSGIPYHFAAAAVACGHAAEPWRLDMKQFASGRRRWNLRQFLCGRGLGGYQYSEAFLAQAEAAIPASQWLGRTLSFNQHFPRAKTVAANGGRLVHYIDATFAGFCRLGGLAARLPARVQKRACSLERDNYAASEWIVTMSRWAATSVVRDCGAEPNKVATILPGANLILPEGFSFPIPAGYPGQDRRLRLGFVGKDWKRKGLPFLLLVRADLERRGVPAVVRCAGNCPKEFSSQPGIEYVGFIDKARRPAEFIKFLTDCDVGCLFSEQEPLGISTLEFLRAGVPVAGFMLEGVADTVPPDAGFRFSPTAKPAEVASVLGEAFQNPATVDQLRANARQWSPFVTWERCVAEWQELLGTGRIQSPVQPWRGLASLSVECSARSAEIPRDSRDAGSVST